MPIKNIVKVAGLVALFAATANAACDNACSGHGTCSADDVCTCYHNWRMGDEDGGDCSDRVCPFEIAWVDHPNKAGTFHNYAECAGRGLCNRESGQCECFEGFTGKGCQRTTCPNDCSGHGTCEYIEELGFHSAYGNYYSANTDTFGQRPKTFAVSDWDNHKTMGCVCDAKWIGLDCSRRMCPKTNDVLHHQTDNGPQAAHDRQVQTIKFVVDATHGTTASYTHNNVKSRSFALTFISTLNETYTTTPIKLDALDNAGTPADCTSGTDMSSTCATLLAADVQAALLALPHRVIDGVTVGVTVNAGAGFDITVTFTGDAVSGPQNLIQVEDYLCGDGCTPKLESPLQLSRHTSGANGRSNVVQTTASEYNNYECGRRGKCDYTSGLCECFDGYYGEGCQLQTALI